MLKPRLPNLWQHWGPVVTAICATLLFGIGVIVTVVRESSSIKTRVDMLLNEHADLKKKIDEAAGTSAEIRIKLAELSNEEMTERLEANISDVGVLLREQQNTFSDLKERAAALETTLDTVSGRVVEMESEKARTSSGILSELRKLESKLADDFAKGLGDLEVELKDISDRVIRLEILAEIDARRLATGNDAILSIVKPGGERKTFEPDERKEFEDELRKLPIGSGGIGVSSKGRPIGAGVDCEGFGNDCLEIGVYDVDQENLELAYRIEARYYSKEELASMYESHGVDELFASCEPTFQDERILEAVGQNEVDFRFVATTTMRDSKRDQATRTFSSKR